MSDPLSSGDFRNELKSRGVTRWHPQPGEDGYRTPTLEDMEEPGVLDRQNSVSSVFVLSWKWQGFLRGQLWLRKLWLRKF